MAEKKMKRAWVAPAMTLPRVVLPDPGGPQRIREPRESRLDERAEEFALAEDMPLADELLQRPGPHPVGQGRLPLGRLPSPNRIEQVFHSMSPRIATMPEKQAGWAYRAPRYCCPYSSF